MLQQSSRLAGAHVQHRRLLFCQYYLDVPEAVLFFRLHLVPYVAEYEERFVGSQDARLHDCSLVGGDAVAGGGQLVTGGGTG